MTSTSKTPGPIDRAAWPALTAFARGYLHEDAAHAHGSLAGAFEAFWADAADDERASLLEEWHAFLSLTQGHSWAHVRTMLQALGAAWMPAGRAAFVTLRRAVQRRDVP